MTIKSIINFIRELYYTSGNKRYIKYLRKSGVKVGDNVIFRRPRHSRVDVTRPSLISIGDNVDMNMNFQILTHDWACGVFRNVYSDFVNSSGKVTIGNNIYFGTNVVVLKGVTIGDNCVIGAGSIVTRDIPANSVATGIPCKVVCTLKEYFQKRKAKGLAEAVEYVRSIYERFGRRPFPEEMREEFIYFVDKDNIEDYPEIPIKFQLGEGYEGWLKTHKAMFRSFDEFVDYALNNHNIN